MNSSPVRRKTHESIERIDFANKMALPKPANRGIAGHFSDGGNFVGQQQRLRAAARRRRCRLTSGVAAADDDHIIVHRVADHDRTLSFSNAKAGKEAVQYIFHADFADQASSSAKHARRKSSAKISNGTFIRPASANASKASSTACNCRSFAKTIEPDNVIFSLAKTCKRSIRNSMIEPALDRKRKYAFFRPGSNSRSRLPACRGRTSSQRAIGGDEAIPLAVRHRRNRAAQARAPNPPIAILRAPG